MGFQYLAKSPEQSFIDEFPEQTTLIADLLALIQEFKDCSPAQEYVYQELLDKWPAVPYRTMAVILHSAHKKGLLDVRYRVQPKGDDVLGEYPSILDIPLQLHSAKKEKLRTVLLPDISMVIVIREPA